MKGLRFGFNEDCSFFGALQRVLSATGTDIAYDDLVGLSGYGHRVQIHRLGWDPMSSDPTLGFPSAQKVCDLLRRPMILLSVEDGEQVVDQAILRTVGAGFPILAHGVIGGPEWSVITRVDDEGHFHGLSYHNQIADEAEKAQHPALAAIQILPPVGAINPSGLALDALFNAFDALNNPGNGAYVSGLASYEYWAKLLEEVEVDPDTPFLHPLGNYVTYNLLIHARETAERFWRGSKLVSSIAGDDRIAIADALQKCSDALKTVELPHPLDKKNPLKRDIMIKQAGALRAAMKADAEVRLQLDVAIHHLLTEIVKDHEEASQGSEET